MQRDNYGISKGDVVDSTQATGRSNNVNPTVSPVEIVCADGQGNRLPTLRRRSEANPSFSAAGTLQDFSGLVKRNKRRVSAMLNQVSSTQVPPAKKVVVDIKNNKEDSNINDSIEVAKKLLDGIEEQAAGFAVLGKKIVSVRRHLCNALKVIQGRKAKKELTVRELDRRLGNVRR